MQEFTGPEEHLGLPGDMDSNDEPASEAKGKWPTISVAVGDLQGRMDAVRLANPDLNKGIHNYSDELILQHDLALGAVRLEQDLNRRRIYLFQLNADLARAAAEHGKALDQEQMESGEWQTEQQQINGVTAERDAIMAELTCSRERVKFWQTLIQVMTGQ